VEHLADAAGSSGAAAGVHGPGGPAPDAPAETRPAFTLPPWLDALAQLSWRLLVVLAAVAGLVVLMTRLYLVSLPVILALVLATIAVPPARRLERRGAPRLVAALVVVVGGAAALLGGLVLLVPAFTRQVAALGPTIGEAFERVLQWIDSGPLPLDRAELEMLVTDALANIGQFSGTIASQVGSIAIAVGEVLAALSLAVVLLFFFVKDGEQIVGWFIARAPERLRDDIRASGARGWGALAGYVRGTAAIALIDAVGIGLGLLIVGVPLVLPLTLLVFLGGFVPVIGAFISGLLATLVALATGGLTTALVVLAIVIGVQQLESNVLQPMIMRRAVSLHPVVILTVLTAGAVIVGVLGAFLAVPIAATLAAVGNELRLRGELRRARHGAGSTPARWPRRRSRARPARGDATTRPSPTPSPDAPRAQRQPRWLRPAPAPRSTSACRSPTTPPGWRRRTARPRPRSHRRSASRAPALADELAAGSWASSDRFAWAVLVDGEPAGFALVVRQGPDDARVVLRIMPAQRGRGAGREVLRQLADHHFADDPQLLRLTGRAHERNVPMQRVFHAAGFRMEARYRDTFEQAAGGRASEWGYALTRTDWEEERHRSTSVDWTSTASPSSSRRPSRARICPGSSSASSRRAAVPSPATTRTTSQRASSPASSTAAC
jgi:putative heme transporter